MHTHRHTHTHNTNKKIGSLHPVFSLSKHVCFTGLAICIQSAGQSVPTPVHTTVGGACKQTATAGLHGPIRDVRMNRPSLKPPNPEAKMKFNTAKVLLKLHAPSPRGAHLAEDQAGIHEQEYKQAASESWGSTLEIAVVFCELKKP